MPEPKRPLNVFLCHAHADRDPVRELYTRLTQDGVDAWLDKAKLLPGQDWELEIRKAVREADVVVVCLSKQFNQAGFRQKEVRLALDTAMEKPEGDIFIIPARLEECDNLESLKRWHWVDLFEKRGYHLLLRALRTRADKIGATFQVQRNKISKTKAANKKVLPSNENVDKSQKPRMFYDLKNHYECDIESTDAETLAKYLLEYLTRITAFVSNVEEENQPPVKFETDRVEYFDPKEGKTLQHAIVAYGKKITFSGNGDIKAVKSMVDIPQMFIITVTQGAGTVRLRMDSDSLRKDVFEKFLDYVLSDLKFHKANKELEISEQSNTNLDTTSPLTNLDEKPKRFPFFEIIGISIAFLALLFGDNIYQQVTGHSIFATITRTASVTVTASATQHPPSLTITPPQITATPVATLTATVFLANTPIVSPTPQVCPSFTVTLYQHEAVSEMLGSSRGNSASRAYYSYQEFEHGFMLWREGIAGEKTIIVLFPRLQDEPYGSWGLYNNTWYVSTPEKPISLTPPGPKLFQPVMGFGNTWLKNTEVREKLGWATMDEISFYAITQSYDNGVMICFDSTVSSVYKPDDYLGKIFAFTENRNTQTATGYWILIQE